MWSSNLYFFVLRFLILWLTKKASFAMLLCCTFFWCYKGLLSASTPGLCSAGLGLIGAHVLLMILSPSCPLTLWMNRRFNIAIAWTAVACSSRLANQYIKWKYPPLARNHPPGPAAQPDRHPLLAGTIISIINHTGGRGVEPPRLFGLQPFHPSTNRNKIFIKSG